MLHAADARLAHVNSREQHLLQHADGSGQSLPDEAHDWSQDKTQPGLIERAASASSQPSTSGRPADPPAVGCLALVAHSLKDEMQALRDGCSYLGHRGNRCVHPTPCTCPMRMHCVKHWYQKPAAMPDSIRGIEVAFQSLQQIQSDLEDAYASH